MKSRPRSISPPSARPTKRTKLNPYLNYGSGLHLAPMVRIGTLPTRLIALEYGANLVWGPEIVDKAIIGSERVVDAVSGTIKYMKKGRAIFECHPLEKSRLIFQLGSACPELAVQAAKVIAQDVAGVGLNCGCPKPFSLSGGMGAALLRDPQKINSILTALVASVPLPIDVKIRLLPSQPETVSLVSLLVKSGISAITVHCRTEPMRSSEPALLDRLQELVSEVQKVNLERKANGDREVAIIANGDCVTIEDKDRICAQTGVNAIMIARGAESNPSCFSPKGLADPVTEIIPLYLRLAIITKNHYANSKYTLNAMNLGLSSDAPSRKARAQKKIELNSSKNYGTACQMFGVDLKETEAGGLAEMKTLLPNVVLLGDEELDDQWETTEAVEALTSVKVDQLKAVEGELKTFIAVIPTPAESRAEEQNGADREIARAKGAVTI